MVTKKQLFLPLVVISVAIVAMFGLMAMKNPPEEKRLEKVIPRVTVKPVTLSNMTLMIHSQGLVESQEKTDLTAQISGQIVNIAVDFILGGLVKQGDLLAQIDPSDYQANLIEAQANLASARASLQQEKAKGKVAEKEWQKIIGSKPSELGLRKPQLAKEIARVRAKEAALQKAKRNLERTFIKAPYDAIVASRKVSLGSVVNSGSTLGQLLATSVAQIRLPIANHDLAYLKNRGVGAKVEITSDFEGKPTSWFGTIARQEGIIDQSSRMNYLVAQITTPYDFKTPLQFGSYVSVKIHGIDLTQAILIPRHLIIDNKIKLLTSDNTLAVQSINLIRQQGDMVVISGLSDDDQYITSALDYPVQGMELLLIESDNMSAAP